MSKILFISLAAATLALGALSTAASAMDVHGQAAARAVVDRPAVADRTEAWIRASAEREQSFSTSFSH